MLVVAQVETIVNEAYKAGGISLLLLVGMGLGLVAIGKYIKEERQKDREEKAALAASFNGAIRDVGSDNRAAIGELTGAFRAESAEARAESREAREDVKALTTQVLESIGGHRA
jgi:hypothetical protein